MTYNKPDCTCIQEYNKYPEMGDVEVIGTGGTISVDIENNEEWGCSTADLPLNYCPCCGQKYKEGTTP